MPLFGKNHFVSRPSHPLSPIDMQSEPSSAPSDLQTLQKQIQDLTEFYNKLQTLRQIPNSLLTPISTDIPFIGPTRPEFQRVKEIGECLRSSSVQEALYRAQESLNTDGTEINSNPRRENRKRRWVSAPRHVVVIERSVP